MYRPKLTDNECLKLSEGADIDVSNRNYNGEKWPVIKQGSYTLDTSFSFQSKDKRWTDIAKKFKGDVLILGLGFGKAVLDACANPNVKSVTVIEINEAVIDVFAYAHGKFKGKMKMSIIHKDALKYDTKKKFDHVFIDIFHDVINIKEYKIQTRQLNEMFKGSEIHQIELE